MGAVIAQTCGEYLQGEKGYCLSCWRLDEPVSSLTSGCRLGRRAPGAGFGLNLVSKSRGRCLEGEMSDFISGNMLPGKVSSTGPSRIWGDGGKIGSRRAPSGLKRREADSISSRTR